MDKSIFDFTKIKPIIAFSANRAGADYLGILYEDHSGRYQYKRRFRYPDGRKSVYLVCPKEGITLSEFIDDVRLVNIILGAKEINFPEDCTQEEILTVLKAHLNIETTKESEDERP